MNSRGRAPFAFERARKATTTNSSCVASFSLARKISRLRHASLQWREHVLSPRHLRSDLRDFLGTLRFQPRHYARHIQAATSTIMWRGLEGMAWVGNDVILRAIRCDRAIRPPYFYGTSAGTKPENSSHRLNSTPPERSMRTSGVRRRSHK